MTNSSNTEAQATTPTTGAKIPVIALGWGLGLLLAVTFTACVLWDLAVPSQAMNQVWSPLLPWFTWISWPSYFIGLAESFAYGWWVAVIFGPLYNYFAARTR